MEFFQPLACLLIFIMTVLLEFKDMLKMLIHAADDLHACFDINHQSVVYVY